MTDEQSLTILHAKLVHGAHKEEVQHLLTQHHDHLLRTLETAPSADRPGGTPLKRPAFPAASTTRPAGGDPLRQAASRLLQIDDDAAGELLSGFKREGINCVLALTAGAPLLEPLEAELALLRYVHKQRCLLLRCVHQLLATAFNSGAELHALACAKVSLLLQVCVAPTGTPSRTRG